MIRRLLTVTATVAAALLFGAAGPAHAQEVAPKPTAAEAGVCGHTDTLYWNSSKNPAAYTCRWRSSLGTLDNYADTDAEARGDISHFVSFDNLSGRDIHLAFYRQGFREGRWITSNLAYNALVRKGNNRGFIREFYGGHYERIRGVVRHRATGREIITPSISLEQCTGPGGQC